MKEQKTVIVTGASKGIGLSIVKTLLTETNIKYNMILIARESEAYTDTIKELKSFSSHTIIPYVCDIGNNEQMNNTLEKIIALDLQIDLLVNNAGYTNPETFLDVDIEDYRHTLEVNVIAPFRIIQKLFHAGKHIKQIVNLGSTSGIGARPGWITYAASKAAMISMSDTLREELSVFGTKVICISPGRCATDLRKTLAPDEDPSTIMQPKHVADVVKFLISPSGHYITSHNLIVRQ